MRTRRLSPLPDRHIARHDLLAVVSTCAMSCQSQGDSAASRFAPFNR
nr:MAG TPA_asm: hypothetical protein [Caudoviricetes sp.]